MARLLVLAALLLSFPTTLSAQAPERADALDEPREASPVLVIVASAEAEPSATIPPRQSWEPAPVPPSPPPVVEVIAFMLDVRALYLASLEHAGGMHAGAELALGARITLLPSWALVLRGRMAMAFDVQTPTRELYDGACGWSGYYFPSYGCTGDADMRFPVGGDVGLRLMHVEPLRDGLAVGLSTELVGTGTVYENSYEHVTRTGGLGGGASVTAELRIRDRWVVGLVAGGRIEASLAGQTGWGTAFGGFQFSLRL